MINFLHTFVPNSIFLKIGPFSIHWYGFLMVIGGLLGFFLILKLAKRYNLDEKFFHDLLIWWVVGAVIGARIYYVIYAWEMYQHNLLDIIQIWHGGLAIHGIMLGGFVTTYLYSKWKHLKFWLMADIIVVGLALAQVVGRVGNYFNQEIFGKPTDLAWGIPIEIASRPTDYLQFEFFHPTFLYESLGNLLIFALLLSFTIWRLKRSKYKEGSVFLVYLILYSVQRFSLEFLRLDYSPIVFGVRWAQLFSVIIILVSVGVLVYRRYKKATVI